MKDMLAVFRNPRIAAQISIGFSSGLPILLVFKTLQSWLSDADTSLEKISWYGSFMAFPYACKFLWSPFFDLYSPPFLGKRRGWLFIIQILLVLAIGSMAFQSPEHLELMAINAVVVAFLGASQDIVADAYRVDILTKAELPLGTAVFTTGYRLALILAFAGASKLQGIFQSWPTVYLIMAGFMAIGSIFTLFIPETDSTTSAPKKLTEAATAPFGDFITRQGRFYGSLILVFIIIYKISDAVMNLLSIPFLKAACFEQPRIGDINGFVGLIATIIGALLGGVLLERMKISRGLLVFGGLQAAGIIFYVLLAQLVNIDPNIVDRVEFCKTFKLPSGADELFVTAIVVENFFGGMEASAFGVFLAVLCNKKFSATQLALLSSLMAVSRLLVAPSGEIVKSIGWANLFLSNIFVVIPSLILLVFISRSSKGKEIDELHLQAIKNESIEKDIRTQLSTHFDSHSSEKIVESDFTMPKNPTVPGDIWLAYNRSNLPITSKEKSDLPIYPDFLFAVCFSNEDLRGWQEKMQEYVRCGVSLSLLIDRQNQTVYCYRADGTISKLKDPVTVNCAPELADFSLQMAKIW
jgi:MFS transporter, PAT family, beta-lactamase induction signal transducer AmpG